MTLIHKRSCRNTSFERTKIYRSLS